MNRDGYGSGGMARFLSFSIIPRAIYASRIFQILSGTQIHFNLISLYILYIMRLFAWLVVNNTRLVFHSAFIRYQAVSFLTHFCHHPILLENFSTKQQQVIIQHATNNASNEIYKQDIYFHMYKWHSIPIMYSVVPKNCITTTTCTEID